VICLIILALIAFTNKLDIVSTFKTIKYKYYLAGALLIPLFINPLISSNRWKIFLEVQGIKEHFLSLVKINFISLFLGIMLPSSTGFDAIRIYIIEKSNRNITGAGGASVIIERLLGFYILTLLGTAGALFILKHGFSYNLLLLILSLNICLALVFIIVKNKYLCSKITGYLSKAKKMKKAAEYLSSLIYSINSFPLKKVLVLTVPLIFLYQLSSVLCGALIFKSFGIDISVFYHLAFLPIIQIISIIPASLSGFGLREGGFIFFYGLIGISSNVCFMCSLLYYFMLMFIPAFIGMFLYMFGNDHFKKANTE